jgi:two-component system, LytTR family, sensor histidine kinase AlgZ
MKSRNTSYWACQIGGWAVYSALGLTTAGMESGWRPSVIIGYLLFFIYSVGLSHLLRRISLRRGWTSLGPARAMARLSAGAILIAALQTGLVVGVYTAIEGSIGVWREPSSIVYMFLWLAVVGNIWAILYFSITSLRHTREARRNETTMKLALSEAELRALESQVNPHFLFNCLNSIRGMVSENPSQAQDMITRLANILRYNLQRDRRHTVPLASEVEIVSDYLALESIRFESRLRVQIDIDEAAREVPVPPMLLQTLVENAIKHGVEDLPAGSEISIRASLDNGSLLIAVENEGVLIEPDANSTRIGLMNARERLRILYGERATLQLTPSPNGRVAATLLIPQIS